jgi:hypothetical protein
MDEQARYSVTVASIAACRDEILLSRHKVPEDSMILDGMACVGGDTISFIQHFRSGTVMSVESDGRRYNMLRHNVALAAQTIIERRASESAECSSRPLADRQAVNGDVCSMWGHGIGSEAAQQGFLACNVLYLDPEWGGPDYYKLPKVVLKIGSETLDKCILDAFKVSERLRFVVLKLPVNFDRNHISNVLEGCSDKLAVHTYTMRLSRKPKMIFVVIERLDGSGPSNVTDPLSWSRSTPEVVDVEAWMRPGAYIAIATDASLRNSETMSKVTRVVLNETDNLALNVPPPLNVPAPLNVPPPKLLRRASTPNQVGLVGHWEAEGGSVLGEAVEGMRMMGKARLRQYRPGQLDPQHDDDHHLFSKRIRRNEDGGTAAAGAGVTGAAQDGATGAGAQDAGTAQAAGIAVAAVGAASGIRVGEVTGVGGGVRSEMVVEEQELLEEGHVAVADVAADDIPHVLMQTRPRFESEDIGDGEQVGDGGEQVSDGCGGEDVEELMLGGRMLVSEEGGDVRGSDVETGEGLGQGQAVKASGVLSGGSQRQGQGEGVEGGSDTCLSHAELAMLGRGLVGLEGAEGGGQGAQLVSQEVL